MNECLLLSVNGAGFVGMPVTRGRALLFVRLAVHAQRGLSIPRKWGSVALGVACSIRMRSHLLTMTGIMSILDGGSAATMIASTRSM